MTVDSLMLREKEREREERQLQDTARVGFSRFCPLPRCIHPHYGKTFCKIREEGLTNARYALRDNNRTVRLN